MVALALGVALGVAAPAARAADPEWAALGSLIIPGMGQAFNGDWGTAALHFTANEVTAFNFTVLAESPDYIEPEDRIDNKNKLILTNRTTFEADLWLTAWFNLHLYSAFGAYRDIRESNLNQGYVTPAPEETLGDLVLAPFTWEYLARPSTFIPLLLPLYVYASPPSDEQFLYQPDNTITRNELAQGFFVQHNMVAVGEEAFFRGFLNNGLSDEYGNLLGLLGSSTLFGLAHQGTGNQATAAGAGVFGLYVGYIQQQNDFRIGQGVAIHFWWNFLVALSSLAERDNQQQVNIFTFATRF